MTVPPPPHDPAAPQQPAPQGAWGQPSPAPAGPGQNPYAQTGPGGHAGPGGHGGPDAPAGVATAAPGTDLASDLGGALKFAGNSLLRNPAAFLVAGLIYAVISVVVIGLGFVGAFAALIPALETTPASDEMPVGPLLAFYGIFFAAALLTLPFTLLWQAGSARSAEIILEGGRPTIGQALIGPMRIILTALLVSVIITVGIFLLYIPGLIAAVVLMYAIPAAARGASPVAALKESVSLVRSNLGTSIVAYLVIALIGSVAGMFVITIVVLVPFMVLFQVGMYQRLNGRELPEPARA